MMSTEENKRVVQSLFDAFSRGDMHAVLELVSEDATWRAPGPPSVPMYGERSGREGAREFFTQLGSNVEFEKFEVWDFIAEGDSVVVTGSERGRAKATGKLYDNDWVLHFKVGGGKVRHFHCYDNTGAVAEAFS